MKSVAVLLNITCHVETALSLYTTLRDSGHWVPALVLLLMHASRGLHPFLVNLGINVLAPDDSCLRDFDYALVVTAYPRVRGPFWLQMKGASTLQALGSLRPVVGMAVLANALAAALAAPVDDDRREHGKNLRKLSTKATMD